MKIVHPVYSPDVAPCYFFFCGHLKCEMAGFTLSSPEEILSEIGRIFAENPNETLAAVYNDWITRLK
jgi:hypothetical protein